MAEVKFNPYQIKAIEDKSQNILISAGAGSGKTTVLVERVIRIITGHNGKPPVNIDRLLIVTFTRAAANHMRQKIGEALNKKIKENPADDNLRKQYGLLNKAYITTIDAFCLMVTRRFFHKIDIDPNLKTADEAEIKLIKNEVLDELFEEKYARFYNDGIGDEFVQLANLFDERAKDDALREMVLKLHEHARSAPDPRGWLKKCADEYNLENGLENSVWYKAFLTHLENKTKGILEDINEALKIAKTFSVSPKFIEGLESDLLQISDAHDSHNKGYEALAASWEFTFARFSSLKNLPDDTKDAQETIKRIRDTYKKEVTKIRKFFEKNYEDTKADILNSYGAVAELVTVVQEFSDRFQEEKKERGLVDFNDMNHFCLQILLGTNGDELTPEAHEIGTMFDEVYIDEYQDSSLIQEAILAAVANAGGGARFMVGDIKQSIYRFRMARPQIFRDKSENYAKNPNEGILIPLMANFRSRQAVIDSINYLFRKIMSPLVGDVEYNAENELVFPQKDELQETYDFKTHIHIIHDEKIEEHTEDNEEFANKADEMLNELVQGQAEAKIAAQQMQKLSQEGIKYSDMVILLRSKSVARVFSEELKNHGIPSFCESDADYFLAHEIMVMLGILQIIDNPRQDIPLLTALFSDIFTFTADELVQIGATRGKTDFYTSLVAFSKQNNCQTAIKAQAFLVQLNKWRSQAGTLSVSKLIFQIYEDTGFYNYAGLLQGGELRRANLMLLFEKAMQFEDSSFSGIFNFVRYIEKLQKAKHNLEKAKVANENDDLVRIMTIHKSKGLEFPVVFLCQLGKRFNAEDIKGTALMDYDLGLGMRHLDTNRKVKSNTFARKVIASKITRDNISEEMRILYVALTRCMDRLYLIGTAKKVDKFDHLQGNVNMHNAARASSYMDWILMAITHNAALSQDAPQNLYDIQITTKEEIKEEGRKEQVKLANIFDSVDAQSEKSNPDQQIFDQLNYKYEHTDAHFVPAKMSVSEIKRLYYNEFLLDSENMHKKEKREYAPPAFLTDQKKAITSASRGIAVHTVLEHLDFKNHTPDSVKDLVEQLTTKGLLTPEEAKIVPTSMIASFLRSELAMRMKSATKIYKEVPFAIKLAPELINASFKGIDGDMVVHGVIDCVFEEAGKLIIVDYKTERVKSDVTSLVEKYRPQMELYKIAAKKIFGLQIDEVLMYFFDIDQAVMV